MTQLGTSQWTGQQTDSMIDPGLQEFRIGDKLVRVDAPNHVLAAPHRKLEKYAGVASRPASWGLGSGTIEIGINDAVETHREPNDAHAPVSGTHTTVPVPTGPLNIKPAWEVDYFRWPRLARRLLKMHHDLFDQIGNCLLEQMEPTRRRIGICSTFPREGKTTLAICLARWAALTGYRVLLIDADIDRPHLTNCSGLDIGYGWGDVLNGDWPLSEALIRSVETGLTFLPASTNNPSLIHHKSLDRLCMISFQMKYEYDIVVMDLGTIEGICVHGTEGMDLVDTMLIARDPSTTSVGQMMDTRTVLHNLGMVKTFVAQNFARGKVA